MTGTIIKFPVAKKPRLVADNASAAMAKAAGDGLIAYAANLAAKPDAMKSIGAIAELFTDEEK